jgi:Lhr-like helicase
MPMKLTWFKSGSVFRRYVENRKPFSYYMKFIAERFGVIPRGIIIGEERRLHNLAVRFKDSPIHTESMREALLEKVDVERTRSIFSMIANGTIKLHISIMRETPTTLAYRILNKFSVG